MKTKEIPREQWDKYLKDFSRVHLGQQVRLWVDGATTAMAREATELPLVGVDVDRSASGSVGIDVIVGDSPAAHVSHHVRQPANVRIATDDADTDLSLQIDSEDGTYVFLALLQPAGKTTPAAIA
jgi:hypothetical protein